jgi:hypothetical protein
VCVFYSALLGDTAPALQDEEETSTTNPISGAGADIGIAGGGVADTEIGRQSAKQSFSMKPSFSSKSKSFSGHHISPFTTRHDGAGGDDSDGSGRISMQQIRRKLADANTIRQRRTVDIVDPNRVNNTSGTNAMGSPTLITPIMEEPDRIASTNSNNFELSAVDRGIARSVSADHVDIRKAGSKRI